MHKNGCDILIPLFFFQGRDVEMIIPLKFYLEKYFHYSVVICSVFDPFSIDIYQPKLIIMENTIGSTLHVKFAEYAYRKGFRVVSLISEGLVIETQQVEQGTWGHNKSHQVFFDKLLAWNKSQKKIISKFFPQLKDKIEVTGALAFDRYKIYSFIERNALLKKYSKETFSRVVGYAGFTFSCFDEGAQSFVTPPDPKTKKQFLVDEKKVRKMLLSAITKYPEILFILKQHPGEPSNDREIDENWVKQFENVIYLKSEEPVADIINICDLWMVYDSTTLLEAWLLNKPTITLMPSRNINTRNNFYKGSLIAAKPKQLDRFLAILVNSSSKLNKLALSKQKNAERILNQMMNRADGLNAAATASQINRLFKTIPDRSSKALVLLTFRYRLQHLFLHVTKKIAFLPVLNKSVLLKWLNEYDQYIQLEKRYLPYLKSFSKSKEKTLKNEFDFAIKGL